MAQSYRTALLWILILSACSPIIPSVQAPPSAPVIASPSVTASAFPTTESPTQVVIPVSTTEVLPPPKLVATLATPHIDQGPDGAVTESSTNPGECGYQWAYQDLPELSASFQQSIQALQPDAQAVAFGFGEDCVHTDMSRTFIPMETDFNVTLQVGDPNDEAALGEWVAKVMQIIESIPAELIIGPRPGRVSILFESNGERKGVNFYIDQYRALAAGLSYQEIYQALQTPQ